MENSDGYYQVLEEIRVARHVSIEDLCEGIISERTYYRYLTSKTAMKFDIFSRLAARIGVKPYEMIYYATFIRTGDPGITRFIYRVHTNLLYDIEPIYHAVKKYHEPQSELQHVIDIYLRKYELICGNISLQNLYDLISEKVSIVSSMDNLSLFPFVILTLSLNEFNHKPDIAQVNKLSNYVLNCDIQFGIFYMLLAVDNLLSYLCGLDYYDLELIERLNDRFYQIQRHFRHMYYQMKYSYYSAYLGSKKQDTQYMVHLMKYLFSVVHLLPQNERIKKFAEVNTVFGIDADYMFRVEIPNFVKPRIKIKN